MTNENRNQGSSARGESTGVDVVLKRLFPPDGIPPCREELANADLWDQFSLEYARVEEPNILLLSMGSLLRIPFSTKSDANNPAPS